jgi:hypothetical protein
MTLQYIEAAVIKTHLTKAIVKELLRSGEFERWVLVNSSKTKTKEDKKRFQIRACNYTSAYSKYPELEWACHEGENNYSVVVRKLKTK